MDPLSVLRDFNTSGKLQLVEVVGQHHVQFGDRYNFPASTPVYKAGSGYYTLQDVLFYLKSRALKPQEYVMAANQAAVTNINIADRKASLPAGPGRWGGTQLLGRPDHPNPPFEAAWLTPADDPPGPGATFNAPSLCCC